MRRRAYDAASKAPAISRGADPIVNSGVPCQSAQRNSARRRSVSIDALTLTCGSRWIDFNSNKHALRAMGLRIDAPLAAR